MLLRKPRFELAAHELGDGHLRGKEGRARGMPMGAVVGDTATGDEAVHVGMIMELLRPGVQNGKDADSAADEAGIAGDLDDGLRCRLHQ